MEETFSLQDLFKVLKKRFSLIILIIVIAITTSGIISFLVITPTYQSSTQILVNQEKPENTSVNPQDIQTNLQLINTYTVIIKSPAILSKVIEELKLDITPQALNEQVTVSSEQNSQVVNISVNDTDPKKAVEIANTIATVFQKEIQTLMNVDNVSILTPAVLSDDPSPVKPKPTMNMAIATVIGLLLGVGVAFLLEYLGTTIKSEQDIEDILKLPVLGLVSPIEENEIKSSASTIQSRRKRV